MGKARANLSIDSDVLQDAKNEIPNISKFVEDALRYEVQRIRGQKPTELQQARHLQREYDKLEREKNEVEKKLQTIEAEKEKVLSLSKKRLTHPLEYYNREINIYETEAIKKLSERYLEDLHKTPDLVYLWLTNPKDYPHMKRDMVTLKRSGITGRMFYEHLQELHEGQQTENMYG